MAEKKAPSRRLAKPDGAAEKAPSRSNHMQNTQAPRKRQPLIRNDVIRCEKCGEDYSVTYKRCPFCDERPGRPGVGHSGRHPVQLVGLVISLAIIAAAVFIVFTYVSPLIFHNQGGTDPGGISSSQGDTSLTPIDGSASSAQEEPTVPVNSITLSRTEFTLQANEPYPITATTDPADVAVKWSSSDTSVAIVDEEGTVTNVNSGDSLLKVTITAAAGDKTAECIVYCRGGSTPAPGTVTTPGDNSSTGGSTTTTPGTTTPSVTVPSSTGTLTANKEAIIVNAGNGLNIRSGPGSQYDVVASAENGSTVVILEQSGDWTKVNYGNGKVGYVASAYLQMK